MRDLPTIAWIRSALLLRRNGPVPGILAAGRTGAIVDKSARRYAAEACSEGVLSSALRWMSSLRMIAVIATLKGFLALRSRS
jgi:hypothetical protein